MRELLTSGFAELGLELTEPATNRFDQYFSHLEDRNQVMNLTAITGKTDVARLHFLDCAAMLTVTEFAGKRVIDVGTGAGFPGLPIKIAEPSVTITLLDSLNKRVEFLKETCTLLGLDDVICLHARAEEAARESGRREHFEIVVSRAVANLQMLCELCLPFVEVGGVFLAMKGPNCTAELREAKRAIQLLGGTETRVHRYTIPGTEIQHSIVEIRKGRPTPAKYPRRFAKIKQQPLGMT